jgi:mannonate dehydratase
MSVRFSRRKAIYGALGAAVAGSVEGEATAATARQWPILEGADTPKLALALGDGGGPLPANLRPPAPDAGTVNPGGRGAGRGGGGYGGYLEQKPAAAVAPAEAANGRGGMRTGPDAYERIRQLGVNHLIGVPAGGGGGPWTVESVARAIQTAKDNGCVAYNAMLDAPESVRHGKPSRAKDLEPYIASVEAAGKAGLPVVEYNFHAHRAIEGYYETVGRARAGYTGFDYELDLLVDPETTQVLGPIYRDEAGKITEATLAAFPNARKIKFKDLPALPSEGAHNLQEMWENVTYFLKAVIPVAEKAGVRMALHPNDPPAPVSRGSQQIMGSVDGWKHFVGIVDSPANGITFDCGVTREMGSDAIATADWFASRKKINHVHFRNVQVVKPYEKYQEVFIDAGMNDMFGVMKALVKNKYTGSIYPEHPKALDADRDRLAPGSRLPGYPGGGGYTGITFSVAYARAMMQAALESV